MRDLMQISARLSIAAGAALFVAGCSGSESANTAANDLGGNLVFEEPANDASAMESAANATDLMADNMANMAEDAETDGGDTGGNSLESNVTGM
jgi:hypothetical protein